MRTRTGLVPLIEREIMRYVRRPRITFIPPSITNVLYFAGVLRDGGFIEQPEQGVHEIIPEAIPRALGRIEGSDSIKEGPIDHGLFHFDLPAI